MIKCLSLLLLLVLPSISFAARTRYVHPGGSGSGANACTFDSPCTLNTAHNESIGGDTILLKDGTYNQSLKITRGGTSNTNRIVYRALNRHQAIVRFTGSAHSHFHIDASWVTVSGLNINATSSGGAHAHDASKISDSKVDHGAIQGVIFEDNYVHDAGHLLIWTGNTSGTAIEVAHNTFDMSGYDDSQGEANYWGSAGETMNPANVNSHHNIFSRYKANGIDFKGETVEGYAHDNFFMDHRLHDCTCGTSICTANDGSTCNDNDTGDGHFIIGKRGPDPADLSTNNRVIDNVVWRPRSKTIFAFSDEVQVRASGNVVIDWVPSPETINPTLNSGSMRPASVTHSNIHCPSEGMGAGQDTSGSSPNNEVNRPISECNTRIDEIVGIPEIASCNIGNINDNTITVEMSSARNGPISWVEIPFEVTYNGVAQTGETTTHTAGSNQARIAVSPPPANNGVTVSVSAPAGAIHNSAFIGGKNCTNGNDYGNADYIRGAGFCGENKVTLTKPCTNTVTGGDPPPPTEALDQAVWRFYQANGAEGQNPVAPENTDTSSHLGGGFRWRVGVRGGGDDAISRSYVIAARLCNPACGSWSPVNDDPSATGIVFMDDQIQDNGTATTNQLPLGGKTFLSGVFMDQPAPTPSVAISSTQQVEWEFSLQVATGNTPAETGGTIQLRMQHDDGTALSAYTLPSITIGSAVSSYSGGSITGTIQ